MNNDELRNWYLSLTDSNKQVFLALVSNDLTIHGRDFGLYRSGIEQRKAFNAFKGLNELQHQISVHIAAIGLKHVKHDRYQMTFSGRYSMRKLPRMAWMLISDIRLILQDLEMFGINQSSHCRNFETASAGEAD